MNLKDPYDPAMLGPLYTGSVGTKRCQTLLLQSMGLGYGIAYRWIYAKLLIRYDLQEKTEDIPIQKTILFQRLKTQAL